MNFEKLLSTRGLVKHSPTSDELLRRSQLVNPEPLSLFYGETYDDKGNPIDSMKYYLFLSLLSEALRQEGADAKPTILVADSAACRNVGQNLQERYMQLGEERAKFIRRVNKIYDTGLRIVKMSEYIHSPEFLEERQRIIEICLANPELIALVEKTVPESKLDIEREKGFFYSFDEITTIIDLDLKVGPPREDLYDELARRIAHDRGQMGVMSLFLTPTFPLGMNWAYFFKNEGIEDHGITAYKAGSKGLQRNRVVVERSTSDYIQNLIRNSFISTNPNLPNPTLDIGIICEMAKRRLTDDDSPITLADDFYDGLITEKQLKETVAREVEEVVLSQF
ncbi:MAG: hypothetical protein PVJ09_02450 [Candidatus Woesebacteria bacterium]|jgi:hypothetical protein